MATGVLIGGSFGPRGGVLPLAFLFLVGLGLGGALAQEPAQTGVPAQTKQKQYVPSPSSSEKAATGQIRILEIEYSCKRSDVTLNEEKLRQNMRSNKGGVYSQQVVDGDIESLYQTGDYTNVQIVTSQVTVDGEQGVRLSVMIDPKVRVSAVEVKRKRADGGLDDELSVDKDDLLDLKLKALTANDAKGAAAIANAFTPKETVTKAGDILSEERMQRDAFAMEDFYRDKGYKDVKIKYKEVDVKGEEAKVVFEIEEGIRGFISKIRFIGNQAVETKDLEKVVKLKPKAWWQLFSKSDRFEELAMKDDLARLKNLYLNQGYIDAKIDGQVDLPRSMKNKEAQVDGAAPRGEDFDPDEVPAEDLTLTYRIEEGRQYRVGTLSIEGNTFFSTDDLMNELTLKSKMVEIFDQIDLKMVKADGLEEGEVYAVNSLQASIETLQNKYGRRGFREARIEYRMVPNVETGRIDVGFSVKEGEKFYVDKIEIQGNTVTKDKVIRREIDLAPGEVFDTVREKASKQKLEGLNYFSKVETYAEETDVPNRQKLIVKVEEKPTGEVSFGAGFSSVELLTGNITLGEKNFDLAKIFDSFPPRGGGQKVRLQASIGFRSQNLNLSFTEPWFLDKPLRLDAGGYY
ncbi:MAG: POTRA domain-containing protein, partial [Verrucomicrobiota bacterium]